MPQQCWESLWRVFTIGFKISSPSRAFPPRPRPNPGRTFHFYRSYWVFFLDRQRSCLARRGNEGLAKGGECRVSRSIVASGRRVSRTGLHHEIHVGRMCTLTSCIWYQNIINILLWIHRAHAISSLCADVHILYMYMVCTYCSQYGM